jgi:hypothetical protein
MGVVTEISTYLVQHKVPGYTFGEKGEHSPFMIQCGTITAPEPSYKPVWNEVSDKMEMEEHPPLNKPEFLRWPEIGEYPGRPGTPVFIKTRGEAQKMIDSGEAKRIRDAYYASRIEAEAKLKARAIQQAVKVSGGELAGLIGTAVAATMQNMPDGETKRGPGRPRNEVNSGV